MKTNVRQTSLDAHKALLESGVLGAQQTQVFTEISRNGPLTRNEIARNTGLPINCVCGRVNELMKGNMISEQARRTCSVTGHSAYVVSA